MLLTDQSWFATNEQDHAKLREFAHRVPVADERIVSRGTIKKVSTRHGGADAVLRDASAFLSGRSAGRDLVTRSSDTSATITCT